MDSDRDGYVDEEELVTGIRQMFTPAENLRAGGAPGVVKRITPEQMFARMDAD